MFTFFQAPYGRHLGFSKGRLFFLKSGNISAYKHHRHLILVSYAQYTPPTTADENLETEHVQNLSCRAELCRRCVLGLSIHFQRYC